MKNMLRFTAIGVLALTACSQVSAAPLHDPTSHAATIATAAVAQAAAKATSAATAATATSTPGATSAPPAAATDPAATSTTAPAQATTAPASTTAPAPTPAPAPTVAPAPTAAPAAGTAISVNLVDMSIRLSQSSVAAGTVTFTVRNTGTVVHEFAVLKTTLAQDRIPNDPAQPGKVQEPGLVGRVASLAPGASGTLTVNLTAGSYVLICNELAHYISGMHTAFTVTQ